MALQKLLNELDLLLSDIAFAGLKNTQPVVIDKMKNLQQGFKELQMMQGYKLIEEFIQLMTDYHTGSVDKHDIANSLCSLEFYIRSALGNL